jgi:hypothetical protein
VSPPELKYIGSIATEAGIDLERWEQVIARHPSLAPADSRMGVNPFTRAPMVFHPHPGTARILEPSVD